MLLANFDPVGDRKFWLEYKLKTRRFAPHEIARRGQPSYLSGFVNSSVDAFLLGLTDHVRPTLEAVIRWAESHEAPDLGGISERTISLAIWMGFPLHMVPNARPEQMAQ